MISYEDLNKNHHIMAEKLGGRLRMSEPVGSLVFVLNAPYHEYVVPSFSTTQLDNILNSLNPMKYISQWEIVEFEKNCTY